MSTKPNLIGDAWELARLIQQKPIERPDFTRALGVSFVKWCVLNDVDLVAYYNATAGTVIDECTLASFAQVQYDCQCNRDEEADDFAASEEAYREAEAEPSDGCEGEES